MKNILFSFFSDNILEFVSTHTCVLFMSIRHDVNIRPVDNQILQTANKSPLEARGPDLRGWGEGGIKVIHASHKKRSTKIQGVRI